MRSRPYIDEETLYKLTHYQAPRESVKYRDTPTTYGFPDIDRLVNHKPYWPELISEDNEEKVKTFIITDFTHRWADAYFDRDLWVALFKQGIKCYVWTGELTEVEDAETLKIELDNVEPISHQALHTELDKKKIEKKARKIIDASCHIIVNVAGQAVEDRFSLYLYKYENMDLEKFILLVNTIPRNKKISIEYISTITQEKLIYLLTYFHDITLTCETNEIILYLCNDRNTTLANVKKIIININDNANRKNIIEKIIQQSSPQTEIEIIGDDRRIQTDYGYHLDDPSIYPSQKIKKIRYKHLDDSMLIHNSIEIISLESLLIRDSLLTDEGLAKILRLYPNLKGLSIINCKNITGSFIDALSHVHPLLDLEMNSLNITNQWLEKILCKYSKIKNLELIGMTSIDMDFSSDSFILEKLEHLRISSSKVIGAFTRLLLSAPNCERLRLDFLPDLDILKTNAATFLKISYIHCFGVKSNESKFIQFLNHFPNIKRIHYGEITNDHTSSKFRNNFPALTYLDVTSDSKLDFVNLLSHAPNLEVINCRNLPSPKELPKSFQHNKIKYFPGCLFINSKSMYDLDQLADTFPELEELVIERTDMYKKAKLGRKNLHEQIKSGDTDKQNELEVVERFIAHNRLDSKAEAAYGIQNFAPFLKVTSLQIKDKITSRDLIKVLQRFPNLKKLELRIPKNLNLESLPKSLAKLSSLIIHSKDSTPMAQIIGLLEHTPYIVNLGLDIKDNSRELKSLPMRIHLTKLKQVTLLSTTSQISLPNLLNESIIPSSPNLTVISLSEANTNYAGQLKYNQFLLKNIIRIPPKLKNSNITQCDLNETTPNGLIWLDKFSPTISEIDLTKQRGSNTLFLSRLPALPKVAYINMADIDLTLTQFNKLVSTYPMAKIQLDPYNLQQLIEEDPYLDLKHIFQKTLETCGLERQLNSNPDKEMTNSFYSNSALNNEQEIDCNTYSDKTTTLHARILFMQKSNGKPNPSVYRLSVETDSETRDSAINLTNCAYPGFDINSDLLSIYKQNYVKSPTVFYGSITVPAGYRGWLKLPSLTSNDELLKLSASQKFELAKDEKTGLYYVYIPHALPQPITISLLLKADFINFSLTLQPEINYSCLKFSDKNTLIKNHETDEILAQSDKLKPKDRISSLAQFINGFKVEKLTAPNPDKTVTLNAIIQERKGVCRHRALAFKAIAKQLGIKSRIVSNDIHVYVEVMYENKWQRIDLGGGEANVKMLPMPVQPPSLKHKKVSSNTRSAQPNPINEAEPIPKNLQTPIPPPTVMHESKLSPTNRFKKWEQFKSTANNYQDFCLDLITEAKKLPPAKRNMLIVLESDQIEILRNQMASAMQQTEMPLYYLHSLDEVSEKQAIISDKGDLATADSQLIKHLDKLNALLMVNWSDYQSRFIGYNTMMDDERKLRNKDIPKDAVVIALIDKNKLNNMGEDFTSRFQLIAQCPALTSEVNDLLPPPNENALPISFFNEDWKNLLLGHINIQGNTFILKKGLLIEAIENKRSGIILENAPWHDIDFRFFMNDLLLHRSFNNNGREYKLPANFSISQSTKAYSVSSEFINFTSEQSTEQPCYLLNSETIRQFMHNITCHDQLIYQTDGWIKENNKQRISVFITENLPANQWAWLIQEAEKHHCHLDLSFATNITYPEALAKDLSFIKPALSQQMEVIVTNDLEMAEENAISFYPTSTVISINAETSFNDLIERLVKADNSSSISFKSELGTAGKQILDDNNVIILKGKLSDKLAMQLESLYLPKPYLWVNGEKKTPKGKLVILSDRKIGSPLIQTSENNYSEKDCWDSLDKLNVDNPQYSNFINSYEALKSAHPDIQFTYVQLRTMAERMKHDQHTNPFKPYFRLTVNTPALTAAKSIWKRPTTKKHADPMKRREDRILSELKLSRYLFAAGPSGVGKSTYLINKLKDENRDVYIGIDNIQQWLSADKHKERILFIDEANLENPDKLRLLEGLFNKTPGILLDGQFHPLSPNHKIVFAGNYQNFAGRLQHELMARHGQVFSFKEMPDEVLQDIIITPALKLLLPDISVDNLESVVKSLLDIYHYTNSNLPNHPMTPRNLNMICLRLLGYLQNHHVETKSNLSLSLKLAMMDELNGIVDDNQKPLFIQHLAITDTEKSARISILNKLPTILDNYFVTESRKNPLHLLHEHFSLRNIKLSSPDLNKIDLSGILIEGIPRIGKSRIVKKFLDTNGYVPANSPASADVDSNRRYYVLTPTDPEKMREILLKAFHEGSIVMIDELNSFPFEKLLNKLLSGYDENGQPANKPGFTIIATQNPLSYADRQVLSTAQENRFTKIIINDYPEHELREIAYHYCPRPEADQIVEEFITARKYAEIHGLFPAPSPGDLFAYLESYKEMKKSDKGKQEEIIYPEDNEIEDPKKDQTEEVNHKKVEDFVEIEKIEYKIIVYDPPTAFYSEIDALIDSLTKESDKNLYLNRAKIKALSELKELVESDTQNKIKDIIDEWKIKSPTIQPHPLVDAYRPLNNYSLISQHRNKGMGFIATFFDIRTDSQVFIDRYAAAEPDISSSPTKQK